MEKTVTEQQSAPLFQMSRRTVILESDEDPSAEETHSIRLNAADVLNLAKRDQTHVAYLVAKAKELVECKAARSLKLEQLEKLEADCNEMRSQRSAVEKQLIAAEAKLLEVEEKNRQLARHTDKALTKKVNRCLCGYVVWQIETLKWLKLQDLER
ncbi:hypothetical protein AXG93_2987s1010 [Marchantia polymorpha subsp. ruderalis]|uniref:Uncharacterized protein n=1 Tax=Marchantia polymorpha subsp. ruderalis TaxID=1480154 RepID=A0A176WRP7_MARPO|nr:hypothetical protein AXG93_2987s1010 [Marchantia polymorpha subsp. ruderalis]